MCHAEGGPLPEIALRNLTIVTVQGSAYNPASAPWSCDLKQITCACPPEYIPWKQRLDLGLIQVVQWLQCVYFSYLAERK